MIALIVTPQGLPLAYEVMNGKTNDSTTLQAQRITRDELLLELGAARKQAGRAWAS